MTSSIMYKCGGFMYDLISYYHVIDSGVPYYVYTVSLATLK